MADLSKLTSGTVLQSVGPQLSKLTAGVVLEAGMTASKFTGGLVLQGTEVVPVPPGGGHGNGGGGGGGGNGGGNGGGKPNQKQKVNSARAWAKGYFSSTWLQVIARRKFISVVAAPVISTPTTDTPKPSGGGGRHRPVKFGNRFYHPERDRYLLAEDVQDWLAERTEAPEVKPVKVKVAKKTVVLPAVQLTEREIVDFEAIVKELNLHQQAVADYIASLRALAQRIEMEDEEEAETLLLVA